MVLGDLPAERELGREILKAVVVVDRERQRRETLEIDSSVFVGPAQAPSEIDIVRQTVGHFSKDGVGPDVDLVRRGPYGTAERLRLPDERRVLAIEAEDAAYALVQLEAEAQLLRESVLKLWRVEALDQALGQVAVLVGGDASYGRGAEVVGG